MNDFELSWLIGTIVAPPIYKASGRTYVADTCGPVIKAVKREQIRSHALVRGHYPGTKLPRGALPGVKTVGFWDADHAQDWGLDWHRNEGIELTLLERGAMPFSVDGKDLTLKPGDLTITRPWQLHRVGNPHVAAGRLHWLILDVEVRRPHQSWNWPAWLVLSKTDLQDLTDLLRHNEQPVWRASDDLRYTFQRIARTVESDSPGQNISRLTLDLNELLLMVLDVCRSCDAQLDTSLSSSYRSVELFLTDLATNHIHLVQEWTVPRMAEECGLGATQFIRHCKQFTNVTPLHYLNNCRLEAARRLLVEQPGRSVTHVALDCGFSTSQYFATVFGQRFGCTPRHYRENGRQRTD